MKSVKINDPYVYSVFIFRRGKWRGPAYGTSMMEKDLIEELNDYADNGEIDGPIKKLKSRHFRFLEKKYARYQHKKVQIMKLSYNFT